MVVGVDGHAMHTALLYYAPHMGDATSSLHHNPCASAYCFRPDDSRPKPFGSGSGDTMVDVPGAAVAVFASRGKLVQQTLAVVEESIGGVAVQEKDRHAKKTGAEQWDEGAVQLKKGAVQFGVQLVRGDSGGPRRTYAMPCCAADACMLLFAEAMFVRTATKHASKSRPTDVVGARHADTLFQRMRGCVLIG